MLSLSFQQESPSCWVYRSVTPWFSLLLLLWRGKSGERLAISPQPWWHHCWLRLAEYSAIMCGIAFLICLKIQSWQAGAKPDLQGEGFPRCAVSITHVGGLSLGSFFTNGSLRGQKSAVFSSRLIVNSASFHTRILHTQLPDSWAAPELRGFVESFHRCLLAKKGELRVLRCFLSRASQRSVSCILAHCACVHV